MYALLPNIGIRPDTITLNLRKKNTQHNIGRQFSMQIVCKTTPLKTTHEIFTRIDFVLRSFLCCCSQLQTEFMFIYLVVLVSVLCFCCDHLFASLCCFFFDQNVCPTLIFWRYSVLLDLYVHNIAHSCGCLFI